MMLLRQKRMDHRESLDFEDSFDALFKSIGSPRNFALFMRRDPEEPHTNIMLVAGQTEKAEKLSPGGWQDAHDTHKLKWMHLVGHDGIAEHYGLELG